MESSSVIKTSFGEFDEVCHRIRGLILIEQDGHGTTAGDQLHDRGCSGGFLGGPNREFVGPERAPSQGLTADAIGLGANAGLLEAFLRNGINRCLGFYKLIVGHVHPGVDECDPRRFGEVVLPAACQISGVVVAILRKLELCPGEPDRFGVGEHGEPFVVGIDSLGLAEPGRDVDIQDERPAIVRGFLEEGVQSSLEPLQGGTLRGTDPPLRGHVRLELVVLGSQ